MTSYTTREGYDLIDPSTVEAEYFIGSQKVDPVTLEDEMHAEIDFSHVVMSTRDGVRFAREVRKGETEEGLVAQFKRTGHVDDHCCLLSDGASA